MFACCAFPVTTCYFYCMLFVLLKIINLFFKTTSYKLLSSKESVGLPCVDLCDEKNVRNLKRNWLCLLLSVFLHVTTSKVSVYALFKRKIKMFKNIYPLL